MNSGYYELIVFIIEQETPPHDKLKTACDLGDPLIDNDAQMCLIPQLPPSDTWEFKLKGNGKELEFDKIKHESTPRRFGYLGGIMLLYTGKAFKQ